MCLVGVVLTWQVPVGLSHDTDIFLPMLMLLTVFDILAFYLQIGLPEIGWRRMWHLIYMGFSIVNSAVTAVPELVLHSLVLQTKIVTCSALAHLRYSLSINESGHLGYDYHCQPCFWSCMVLLRLATRPSNGSRS